VAAALAGALVVAIAWTFSRGGHPVTTPPAWLSVSIDMAHLLAMATWLGGLLMLVVAVFPRRDADELRRLLPTFSTVAFTAVTVLVASGAYSAWRGIGTVHAIFATTYGLLVVGKVVLLVGILIVANMSRRLVRGGVVAYAMTDTVAAAPELSDGEIATERLRRSVWVEAVVAFVVLAFSAVLVGEPRGKEALHPSSHAMPAAHAAVAFAPDVLLREWPVTGRVGRYSRPLAP
jgi:copper transport protein